MRNKRTRRWLVMAAAASYGAAFFLPVGRMADPQVIIPGSDAFLIAYHGMLHDGAWFDRWLSMVMWLANPATWIALALTALCRWKAARLVSGVGLLSGVSAAWYFPGLVGESGFWFWVAGSGMVFLASATPPVRRAVFECESAPRIRATPGTDSASTLLRPAITANTRLLRPGKVEIGESEPLLIPASARSRPEKAPQLFP